MHLEHVEEGASDDGNQRDGESVGPVFEALGGFVVRDVLAQGPDEVGLGEIVVAFGIATVEDDSGNALEGVLELGGPVTEGGKVVLAVDVVHAVPARMNQWKIITILIRSI